MKPSFERVDDRGTLMEVINHGRWESLLFGEMKAQAVMGNHYHKRTEVMFFLTQGQAEVTCLDVERQTRSSHVLGAREGIMLAPHVAHAIQFREDSSFMMLKSVRYDPADPDTFPCQVVG